MALKQIGKEKLLINVNVVEWIGNEFDSECHLAGCSLYAKGAVINHDLFNVLYCDFKCVIRVAVSNVYSFMIGKN